ncbi:MAG: efflux RND transporter periplasmic adaptor subunit [Nitrospirae bacterium]|nr:efflux RND transporter periplasmic adaptor subunit [Nitrospirota bacterium]
MKTKIILSFVGGFFVAMILAGTVWRFHGRIEEMIPGSILQKMLGMPIDGSPQAVKMKDMPDMEMGSSMDQKGIAQVAVMIPPTRRQLIGVKSETIEERAIETVIRTVGSVDYDERRMRQINLRVSGWITKLFVDYTGKLVKKGDPLFKLYSPDLVSTQEEYLLAKRTLERVKASTMTHIRSNAENQVESARNRLLLWGLTEKQVSQLEQGEKPQMETTIYSPIDGVVTKKTTLQGMYVTPEMNLYEVADLSVVWIYADIYEYEIPLARIGDVATVTLASYPGKGFSGKVVYIYPYLSTETRTVKVRMEFPNPDGKLKPGMYGNVEIRVKAGIKPAIPQEAVLDSGIRKLVFIDRGEGMYEPREVKLGPRLDNYYEILDGVKAGDRVVTSANFLIDSESKLRAATSMMGALGMGGIRMEQARMGKMEGEMEMGGMKGMKGMKGMETAQAPGSMEQTVDGLTLTVTTMPKPPKKGENIIHLSIKSKEGPVTDAKVTISYTMVMSGMGSETVEARHTGEGIYEAKVDLGMKGGWNIDVSIERGKAKPVKAKFTIKVEK